MSQGWSKLSHGFFRHPRVVAATPSARLLYLASLCYAGEHLTDGHIPAMALEVLCAEAGVRDRGAAALRLVEVGLWVDDLAVGGWRIHDYAQWNLPAETVRERRAGDAQRARTWRDTHRTNGVRTADVPRTSLVRTDVEIEIEEERERRTGGTGGDTPPVAPPVAREEAGTRGAFSDPDGAAATLWRGALEGLRGQMSAMNYGLYFERTRGLALDADTLVVGTPNPSVAEGLRERFGTLVRRTLEEQRGAPLGLRVVLLESST